MGTIREVYFPSLPAATTFHVIAANSDGVWNNEGARAEISRAGARLAETLVHCAFVTRSEFLIIFAVFRLRGSRIKTSPAIARTSSHTA